MAGKAFSWDKHCSKLTWNEVRENSPVFDGQRRPSLFSPDNTRIYVF